MPSAKDVRDILDIPQNPETDAPPKPASFTLKQPPPGRGVSFIDRPIPDPQQPEPNADAGPSTSTRVRPAGVSSTIAENLQDAERWRRAKQKGLGVVRELYKLVGDSAPSLARVGGGEQGGAGGRRWGEGRVGKWQWMEFSPSNRPDGPASSLHLGHWRKIVPDAAIQKPEDEFAAFGRAEGTSVVGYTQTEYEQWLQDDKWTADETNYLFSLLTEYDLRFLVVADRYAYLPKPARAAQNRYAWPVGNRIPAGGRKKTVLPGSRRSVRGLAGVEEEDEESRDPTPGGEGEPAHAVDALMADVKRRSIEEIKDRYYTICRRLIRNRPAKDEAAREKALKAYEYDMRKETQRKRYADSLFHLTRPQIQEEEALYMEMKKIEQTERRYRSEREELMIRMNGLESGVVWPSAAGQGGNEGNRVFGNGTSVGIGSQRARDGTVVGADKLKKRKRGDEAMDQMEPDQTAFSQVESSEDDPEFDRRNNIYRLPSTGGLNPTNSTRTIHQPVFLRSTKLAQPRTTSQVTTNKITTLLEELGVSASRLIMPTRENLERYEALLSACGMLVDVKRMVDRAEQEVRVLKMQKESGVVAGTAVLGLMAPPPVPVQSDGTAGVTAARAGSVLAEATGNKRQKQRSASVVSSTPSEAVSRRRK